MFAGLISYGDKPLLAAFTAYDHGLSAKGDIAYIDPGDFSAAQSAVKHKQHKALVAKAVMRKLIISGTKQLNDLVVIKNKLLLLMNLRKPELTGKIIEVIFADTEIIECLNGSH